MNDLQIIGSKETMTSREIAEITGKRHSDVMRDIRTLSEQVKESNECIFALVEYIDEKGENRPMYSLSKKECLLLASGYKPMLRLAIINRWEELEKTLKLQLPQTYLEALKALVESEEEKLKLQIENKEMLPKAEFYDDVTGSNDCFDMATVAKVLNMGIGRNKLFEILRDKKVLQWNNKPFQKYVDLGWFRLIESKYSKPNGDTCINIKTVVFQKGVDGIRKIIK